jgi:cholesterol transport system auxiliary component
MRTFDLGPDAPSARLPGLRAVPVRASAPFDTGEMHYRLAFRNSAELLAFSQSRWAATPAVLLQRRFSRASDGPVKCALEFDLSELSQVFATRDVSEIVLEGRAVLFVSNSRVAERTFRIREPDAGSNAESGAIAVARAADRLIGEISVWSSGVASCRAG